MRLSSVFEDQTPIPARYTCEGQNVRPPFMIAEVPHGTKSLVMIVSDPDAPSGDFTHWLAWNISPDTDEIKEGALPEEVVEGTNDFGKIGWGGPCPPQGTHRYVFHLYALDTQIELPEISNKTDLVSHISGLILDEAVLIGLYGKTG